jgi:hypothetical protein
MASFGGFDIFGRALKIREAKAARAKQRLEAPGVNGQGTLDMGFRGRSFQASGILIGSSGPNLAAAVAAFESFQDGNVYVLVDTMGRAWPYVELEEFQQAGEVRLDFKWGYFLPYSASFHQLREA